MSLLSEHIQKNPKHTQRLVGIDHQSLQELVARCEVENQKQKSQRIRVIASGGGRKSSLSVEDQILLTLTYLRQHHTFQALGINFGISEAHAHNIFHYWLKILNDLLPPSLLKEFRDEYADEYEELLDDLSEIELIVDSSEQPRQRPKDKDEREKSYSGYKHQHTSKNFCSYAKR